MKSSDTKVTTLQSCNLDERRKPKILLRSKGELNKRSKESTQNHAIIKDLDKDLPLGCGDHAI